MRNALIAVVDRVRYLVRQMREKPAPPLYRLDVQERIARESEQFLNALVGKIPFR